MALTREQWLAARRRALGYLDKADVFTDGEIKRAPVVE